MSISEHKHMPEPVRRMEVFTGAGRRRSWSAAEKAVTVRRGPPCVERAAGAVWKHQCK